MSLSGAMTSAVTGIEAQSRALGAISDNISNSQTTGYKRVDTEFSTLLTVSNAFVHEPGGVTSKPLYTNDLQGTVQQTSVPTNLAVSGEGYFAVSRIAGVSGTSLPTFEADPLYTRAGDFSVDNNGYLVNNGGYVLNGWKVDPATGQVSKNQLVQIQLNQLKSDPLATSSIAYSANLPTTPAQNLNISGAPQLGQILTFSPASPTFTDGDTVTVTQGGVTTQFLMHDTTLPVTVPPTTPAVATGSQVLVDFASTTSGDGVAKLVNAIPLATAIVGPPAIPGVQAAKDTYGNLSLLGTSANPVTTISASLKVGAASGSSATDIQFASNKVNFFDAQGAAHPIDVNWTKVAGTNDTYTVTCTSSDPAIVGITPPVTAPATIVFNLKDDAVTGAKAGSIKTINGTGGAVGSPVTIPLAVTLGGGTPVTQDISFGLGSFGVAEQTTMFTGTDVNFVSAQQDGLPPGSFRNLDIDAHGLITLNFDNGARKTEFEVPLVQFSNYDGLQAQNGNAFSTTVASGTPSIHAAGDNGTGSLVASSVEGANVDIASEFTKLIQTQRAYEANTKVITAVDTLLQETNNLIR
jgi:flagellar hook protein FlgE